MISNQSIRRSTAVILIGLTLGIHAGDAFADEANGWSPDALELRVLPRYCQAQFLNLAPPQVTPMSLCGNYANHLCPGMVLVNRASKLSIPKHLRKRIAKMARGEIDYTKKYINPSCPLASDLAVTDARLRNLEIFLK